MEKKGTYQHVSATINSAETSKSLRKLTKTIERVDVGRLAVLGQGLSVQLHAVYQAITLSWPLQIVVIQVQSQGVTKEVNSVRLQSEILRHQLLGGLLGHIHFVVGFWVIPLKVLNKLKELLASPLLKQSHQGGR